MTEFSKENVLAFVGVMLVMNTCLFVFFQLANI
jgi:hypothetical protein